MNTTQQFIIAPFVDELILMIGEGWAEALMEGAEDNNKNPYNCSLISFADGEGNLTSMLVDENKEVFDNRDMSDFISLVEESKQYQYISKIAPEKMNLRKMLLSAFELGRIVVQLEPGGEDVRLYIIPSEKGQQQGISPQRLTAELATELIFN